MKLIDKITVFPLISTLDFYLILNLVGAFLIRGQRLKKGGAYFKVRETHHTKFQKLISAIVSLFKCMYNHTTWIHMNISFNNIRK